MSTFTEPTTPEAVPTPQTAEPPTAEVDGDNNAAFATVNPFLDFWLEAIARDSNLSSEAPGVASVMARSVGIGRVAYTDWQRINTALGRRRRDLSVFEIMSELELEGYLGRNMYDSAGWSRCSYGWSLLIPESNCE